MNKSKIKKLISNIVMSAMIVSTPFQNTVIAQANTQMTEETAMMEAIQMEASEDVYGEAYEEASEIELSASETYEDEYESAEYEEESYEEYDSDGSGEMDYETGSSTWEAETDIWEEDSEDVLEAEMYDSDEEQDAFEESEETTEEESVALNQYNITGCVEYNGVTVYVDAPAESFPEGTTVSIAPYSEAEAAEYANNIDANYIDRSTGVVAFDIGFSDEEGEKVQPEDGKSVNISFGIDGSSPLAAAVSSLEVYHVGSDANDFMGSVQIPEAGTGTTITIEATEFSPYVVMSITNAEESALLLAADEYVGQERSVVLSDFTLTTTTSDGTLHAGHVVELNFKWDASSYGTNLHAGDYFIVELPEALSLNTVSVTPSSFDLANEDGVVFATAVVDRDNHKVTATFNSNVEERYNVKGTMKFRSYLSQTKVTVNEENVFTIRCGSSVESVIYEVLPAVGWYTGKAVLHKNGSLVTWNTSWGPKSSRDNVTQASWSVRINVPADTTLHNVVITDSLAGANGGSTTSTYIEGSFALWAVDGFNEFGTPYGENYGSGNRSLAIDISDKLTISEDGKSFTLNLGDVSNSYYLSYYTTFDYVAGNKVTNSVNLTSTEQSKSSTSSQSVASGSGTADATIANRIKLIKVDAENTEKQLSDATFEVTRPDGTTFTLTTGSDGTVTSGILTQGTYTVKEITAPTGYEINEDTFTAEVTADGVALTISDQPIKTEVKVTKKWNDAELVRIEGYERPTSVTVRLYANDTEMENTLTLDAGNNWQGTFTNLAKYKDGQEIVYTVREEVPSGYESQVTGSAEKGFTITNTPSVGEEIDPVTLSIHKIDGTSGAAGNVILTGAGFGVYTDPELETQVGHIGAVNNQEEITEESETQEGLAGEVYSYIFTEAGTYYIVETTAPTGYQLSNAVYEVAVTKSNVDRVQLVDGVWMRYYHLILDETTDLTDNTLTITNEAETTEVSGTKTWDDGEDQDGIRPEWITVNLLANDQVVDTQTVTPDEDGAWTYRFTNLPTYRDGQEIVYSVTEEPVDNYTTTYDGNDIINVHIPETVEVSGTKTWDDDNDRAGKRPKSITVNLLANETIVQSIEVTADDDWSYSFTNLPKNEAGKEIVYTITENEVTGYTTTYNGYDITNSYTPVPTVTPTVTVTPKATVTPTITPKAGTSSKTGSSNTTTSTNNSSSTTQSPKTGDTSNIGYYLIVLLLSLIILMGCFFFRKRHTR